MIKVDNLTFGYSRKLLFNGLNFHIKLGQWITLIGPNGCGKSTLLKLLTGVINPESGKLTVKGKDINDYSTIEVAKLFTSIRQQSTIRFPYTCLDFVLMGRRPYRQRFEPFNQDDYFIAKKAMNDTDTLSFATKSITELSGGEAQRVLLAKALTQNTQVLYLDEAFSAMDLSYKIKCMKLLKQLVRKENLTIISVMHDINLAYQSSDKVAVMKDGEIYTYGTANKILDEDIIEEVFKVKVKKIKQKGFIIEGGF